MSSEVLARTDRTVSIPLGAAQDTVTVTLTPAMVRYNEIRLHFERRAAEVEAAFSAEYDRTIKGWRDLEQVPAMGMRYLDAEVNRIVPDLVAKGAYTVSGHTFVDRFCAGRVTWGEGINGVLEQLYEVDLSAEELDAYRVARREGRGRVIGGGFGLDGAVKGMVAAGAANLAIGAVHATFNGVAKVFSAVGNEIKKADIFVRPATKENCCHDIFMSIWQMHYAYIDALNAEANARIATGVRQADVDRSRSIFDNISKGHLSRDRIPAALSECLSLSPYEKYVYDYILGYYDDPNMAVEKAAAEFGIDLRPDKLALIDGQVHSVLSDAAVAPQQKYVEVLELCARLGFPAGTEVANEAVHTVKESLLVQRMKSLDFATHDEAAKNLPVLAAYADSIDYKEGYAEHRERIQAELMAKRQALAEADKTLTSATNIYRVIAATFFLLLGIGLSMSSATSGLVMGAVIAGVSYRFLTKVEGTRPTLLMKKIAHMLFAFGALIGVVSLGHALMGIVAGAGTMAGAWHLHDLAVKRLRAQGLTPSKSRLIPAAVITLVVLAVPYEVFYFYAKAHHPEWLETSSDSSAASGAAASPINANTNDTPPVPDETPAAPAMQNPADNNNTH